MHQVETRGPQKNYIAEILKREKRVLINSKTFATAPATIKVGLDYMEENRVELSHIFTMRGALDFQC